MVCAEQTPLGVWGGSCRDHSNGNQDSADHAFWAECHPLM